MHASACQTGSKSTSKLVMSLMELNPLRNLETKSVVSVAGCSALPRTAATKAPLYNIKIN